MSDNNIMQFEEVMKYLNIGKSTLYDLLRNGAIKAFKIGRVWKIPKSSVDEYINRKMKK